MDVLKELFGGSEDFDSNLVGKFGSQAQIALQHEDLHKTAEQSQRSELLPAQPAFPPLPIATGAADIGDVPEEMPMYLLADDEGNEEEIFRLLGTPEPHEEPSTEATTNGVSVLFPWMTSSVGVNVTPVQVHLSNSIVKKKPRHGGGWPKGKSRKPLNAQTPPKPPTSGYGIFLSEHMANEKTKGLSMAQVSKELGKLWSSLSSSEKQVYHDKSSLERECYLSELRRYLLSMTGGGCVQEDIDKVLTQTLTIENNDTLLTCDVCKLSFTSLHNKRCHFSGRLHMQSLMDLVKSSVPRTDTLVSSVCSQTVKYNACIGQVSEEMRQYKDRVHHYATLQQTAAEQEFLYSEAEETLAFLQGQWTMLTAQFHALMPTNSVQ